MMNLNPKVLLLIGFLLLVIGAVLPTLMVIQVLESTFFLNFFAFGASFLGLILGLIGVASIAVRNRSRNRNKRD